MPTNTADGSPITDGQHPDGQAIHVAFWLIMNSSVLATAPSSFNRATPELSQYWHVDGLFISNPLLDAFAYDRPYAKSTFFKLYHYRRFG